jgi:hypothetical protein
VPERRRKCREELLIDYKKSIMLTSNDYLHSMEVKAARKEKARYEAEQRKVDAEKRKDLRAAEKLQKQAEKAQREKDVQAREVFKQKWSADGIREAGKKLRWLVKNMFSPPPSPPIAPFCGQLPQICKDNMAHRLARWRVTRIRTGNVSDILPATLPA